MPLVRALLLALLVPAAALAQRAPLTQEEVLRSLDRSFPLLLAEQEKVEKARGGQTSAASAFDTKAKVKSKSIPVGKDEYGNVAAFVAQSTPYRGLSLEAGWTLGTGDIPEYSGDLVTNTGGEIFAGASVPLLRGGAIDTARAEIASADLLFSEAEAELGRKRLGYRRAAALKYWDWVAAGAKLDVERALLSIAETRDIALRERLLQGAIPEIEVIDNQRVLLSRRLKVIDAERKLEQSAQELSIYYRDASGKRLVVSAERLPSGFPTPTTTTAGDGALARAVAQRPELRRLDALRDQAEVERRLAKNLQLPSLDLSLLASQGLPTVADEKAVTEFAFGLSFELPAQNRKARGAQEKASALFDQVEAERRYAEDTIAVELATSTLSLDAAYRRAQLAQEGLVLARQLEEAERARFDLGASTLLIVNLREQATAEAALAEIDALAEYWKARAELAASLGEL